MELGTVLPEGMRFPYDFGFVPSTLGVTAIHLTSWSSWMPRSVPGCVIKARPIGTIEAKQKKKGEDWERNDRLIGIAVHSQTHDNAKALDDLRPHLVEEIQQFFVNYNELRGRKFKPIALCRPHAAEKLIQAGMKTFKKQKR